MYAKHSTPAPPTVATRVETAVRTVWLCFDIFGRIPTKRTTLYVDRYRGAAVEPEDEPGVEMCRQCQEVPATHSGRCWDCNLGRRIT